MKQYQNRGRIIYFIITTISLIYIVKLFYIQVINKDYKFSAKNNALRYEVQQPVRGLIYDRDSVLIVANIPAYDLVIIPRELKNKIIDTLSFCSLLNISKIEFINRYEKALAYSSYKESVFIKHINLKDASRLAVKLFQYPGFHLRKITMRDYPEEIAAHVIGYLGETNAKILEKNKYYTKGDLVGVSGIESAYEKELRGVKGMAIKLVDVLNRDQGKFQEGKFDTLPIAGNTIISTIDVSLQKYTEKLMQNKKGAIVAIEPKTGEILTLVSSPSYKPSELIGRKRSENYLSIIKDKNKPLFNRALQGIYPPGSIFKLINGLIALQEGVVDKNDLFFCNNGYEYEKNKKIKCHPHKSPVSLEKSIEISCNTYFCSIFERYFSKFENTNTAYSNWYSHVSSFGVGNFMNNDFTSGNKGKLPKKSYYDNLYKNSWNSKTIISMSIGQGELLLTPIQMANIAAIIANKGYYITPHIVKKIENKIDIDKKFKIKKYCSIEKKYFDPIIDGMQSVIKGSEGTAKNSIIQDIEICGKTGTAQNPHGKDHSIFIAFAPKEDPKIAIAVYVENGGWGSDWAAPIASLAIEKYLTKKIIRNNLEKYIIKGNLLQ